MKVIVQISESRLVSGVGFDFLIDPAVFLFDRKVRWRVRPKNHRASNKICSPT